MESYESHRRHPSRTQSFGWPILFLLLFLTILLWRMFATPPAIHQPDATPRIVTARGELAQDELATIELFKLSSSSVVHITTLALRRDALTLNLMEIPSGTGSGVIWSEDGYVVTNYHVLQNSQGATVRLSDNSSWPGKLVGTAPDKDLAVLKIEAPRERLHAIAVGTSADLQVGQKVFAIGNPFGLDQTLTTGVISGLGREIESVTKRPIQDVIQTDAAINPGNSGGALLDSAGRLVGINTAIYSPSGAYAGIGFAVPVDTVNLIVPQLIKTGRAERPGLGVRIVPDAALKRLGLKGVMILDVVAGSAADAAGLQGVTYDPVNADVEQLGDLIVAVNETPVANARDLFRALGRFAVGDEVQLTIVRNEQQQQVTLELQSIDVAE